jgi:hypothetical protein
MTNESHYEHGAVMDTLKGAALIGTFIAVLATFAGLARAA